jgi:CO/xanthine dehydrogenase FAD-binding subunit
VLAGGTDMMVEITFGQRRPDARPGAAADPGTAWPRGRRDRLRFGAMLTYTQMERELAELAPGLAMAARTVGSPQIRNAGTIGGNLGTASPAGDTLPWLLAMDARSSSPRSVAVAEAAAVGSFITGPKRTAREPDELITAVTVPRVGARSTSPRSALATRW